MIRKDLAEEYCREGKVTSKYHEKARIIYSSRNKNNERKLTIKTTN